MKMGTGSELNGGTVDVLEASGDVVCRAGRGGRFGGGSGAAPAASAPAPSSGGSSGASAPSSGGLSGQASQASQATQPSAGQTSQGGGASAAGQAAQQQWTGVREALAGLGVDLRGQFQDDQAALGHMAVAYRQSSDFSRSPRTSSNTRSTASSSRRGCGSRRRCSSRPSKPRRGSRRSSTRVAADGGADPITNQLEPAPVVLPDVVQKLQAAEVRHRRGFLEKLPFDPMGR